MKKKSDVQNLEEVQSLIKDFTKEMGYQLALNMNKGGWKECHKDFFLTKIKRNIIILEGSSDPKEVTRISANIANYCAMYSDNFKN